MDSRRVEKNDTYNTVSRLCALDSVNMRSDISYLLETLSKPALVIVSLCYILLAFVFVPFPLNYIAAPLPAYIAFAYDLRDERRIIRLGFCHDRVREIGAERMQMALDYIEREQRKTKHLP